MPRTKPADADADARRRGDGRRAAADDAGRRGESPPEGYRSSLFGESADGLAPLARRRNSCETLQPLPATTASVRYDVGDPLRGVAVPEGRGSGRSSLLGQSRWDLGDRGGVEAEQGVGAGGDRDRALGVVAQGEAGDAEVGRLLLDAAGVGEDGAGVGEQGEEVEVAERLAEQQARVLGRRSPPSSPGCAGGPGRRPASRGASAASCSTVSASSGPSTRAGRCRVTRT